MMDAGGPLPGRAADGRQDDLRRGHHHPADQGRRARRGAGGRARADPQQRPHPGDEPGRPVRDRRRLPRRRGARDGAVRRASASDTYLAALQALLDRTHEAMRKLILHGHPGDAADVRGLRRRRRARQRPVQDEADDLARGGPRLLRLVGDGSAGHRTGELLPLRGHVQDVHRGLPDHGERPADPLQRRLLSAAPRRDAGGQPAAAALPGGARLPHARAGAALRRARRRALQERARPQHGGRLRHQPLHALLGLEGVGRRRAAGRVLLLDGDPLRRDPRAGPIGDGMDGHSWWPLFENIPTEYLEAYYPLRIDGYTTVTGLGRRGPAPRRQRRREALRLPRAGRDLDPRRPLADAAVGRARRPAGRAQQQAARARGRHREQVLPSKCDEIEVQPGDMLVYRTAGGGGWKDRLDRPAEAVARDVSFGLVSARARRRATASCSPPTAASTRPRPRPSAPASASERGDALAFDFGPSLEETLANCLAETGLEPPTPAKPLRWSPLEPGDAALKRVRDADAAAAAAGRLMDDAEFYRERGFGGTAGFGRRPALLVIDLVNGFTDPSSPLGSDLDAVVAATRRLIDACRAQGRADHLHDGRLRRREEPGGRGLHGQDPVAAHARRGLARGADRRAPRPAAERHADHEAVRVVLLRHRALVAARRGGLRHGARHAARRHRAACGPPRSTPSSTATGRSCRASAWATAPRRPHEANLFDIQQKYGDVVGVDEAIAAVAALPG